MTTYFRHTFATTETKSDLAIEHLNDDGALYSVHQNSATSADMGFSTRLIDGYLFERLIEVFDFWTLFHGDGGEPSPFPDLAWATTEFDDTGWEFEQEGFGYEDSGQGGTGEIAVDAGDQRLTGFQVISESGIFTGDAAENLGGPFDVDRDDKIAKATFGSDFGDLSFGNVTAPRIPQATLLDDLTVTGTLSRTGSFGPEGVDLVYIPEPASLVLALLVSVGLVGAGWRRR